MEAGGGVRVGGGGGEAGLRQGRQCCPAAGEFTDSRLIGRPEKHDAPGQSCV